MKRLVSTLAIALASALWLPLAAQADFGLNSFDVTFTNADGTPATQAGSHPFAMTTSLGVNFTGVGKEAVTEGRLRDVILEQVPGLAGDTTAYPRCSTLDFLTINDKEAGPSCPLDTVVGVTANEIFEPGNWQTSAVFNLVPPPGALLRLAFRVANEENIVIDVTLEHTPPYRPIPTTRNLPQLAYIFWQQDPALGQSLRPRPRRHARQMRPGDEQTPPR